MAFERLQHEKELSESLSIDNGILVLPVEHRVCQNCLFAYGSEWAPKGNEDGIPFSCYQGHLASSGETCEEFLAWHNDSYCQKKWMDTILQEGDEE